MDNQTQTPSAPTAQQNQNGHAAAQQRRYACPRANVVETSGGYVVQVEMPGVNKTGLEVTFENGELTLVGHRTPVTTNAELVYRESRPMDFRRVFEVDPTIDAAHIAAQLDQGVLTLTLPKAESSKPRRIEVGGLN
jgi:HSP20 family protein